MLLQVNFNEGTVYFLILTDDLAARGFDGVFGVYRQA